MKWVRLILLAAVMSTLFWFLDAPHQLGGSPVPAPGRFLNPFAGFWLNGDRLDRIEPQGRIPSLEEPVTVLWDEHRVPHVFAANLLDLYRVQGYLTARDRLWQMEFQTHAAAGRLTEIIGPAALELDRYRRRTGLPYAAEKSLKAILADPVSGAAYEAYTEGVNDWIRSLDDRDLPLEYKILGYRPEPWTTLKSALLLKHMTMTLSGYTFERSMSLVRSTLGHALTERLFPDHAPFTRPIVPEGTPFPFRPLQVDPPAEGFTDSEPAGQSDPGIGSALGSNNWALDGSRTAGGYPILCNDIHLPVGLPSIWYEMQLTAPGSDVYGGTLVGAPGIIVGFNRSIAWGVTNAESDAADWYRIRFRDDSRSEYFHDGSWKPVTWREETYRIRGAETVTEKVPYTHHGPVAYAPGEQPFRPSIPVDAAFRWTGHEPTNEARAFLDLNRAGGYEEFVRAISRFDAPGMNFAFAGRDDGIAMHHAGLYPVRWKGQGKYLSDGTDPAYDWTAWVPRDHLPHLRDPERGFVSSANQNPVGPDYPYYLGHRYAPWERIERIDELLLAASSVTPADMIAMQRDVLSPYARRLLPALLQAVDREALSVEESEILAMLERWNLEYRADDTAPLAFDYWQREFLNAVWLDETGTGEDALRRPGRDVTVALLERGELDPHLDDVHTERKENLRDIALGSLRQAVGRLVTAHGPPGEGWEWGTARGTDLRHVGRIPGLGRIRLRTDGQYGLIRATTGSRGQSWWMVVETGPEMRGWGIYPGGQSGHPGSPHYDDFVDRWIAGDLREFLFPRTAGSGDGRFPHTTEYVP